MKLRHFESSERFRLIKPLGKVRRFLRLRYAARNGLKMLRVIEEQRGPLPKELMRRCDEYALEVLGDRNHAPWLYVYAASQRDFKEGWIPFSYYIQHVTPATWSAGMLSNDRHLSRRLLKSDHLPDAAYAIGGKIYDSEYRRVKAMDAADVIFRGRDDVFFKSNRSSRGNGIRLFMRKDFPNIRLDALPDGVFQTRVVPHHAFDGLLPDRGPTIRLTTVLNPQGKAEIRAAHLRVSRRRNDYVRPTDSVNISIDLQTGCLVEHGYLNPILKPLLSHPDTGFVFKGHPMPRFHDAVLDVVTLHDGFPLTKIVGWDVCIDRDNRIQLYEWNSTPEIRFIETTSGPHFRGLGWENLWR